MPERNEVTINVFNGTQRTELADQIGYDFENRGFKVNVPKDVPVEPFDQVAMITFGPQAVGAGYLVSAYFLVDEAKLVFDIKREKAPRSTSCSGRKFQQLATTTEVNQSIAAIGNPEPPEGTCAV